MYLDIFLIVVMLVSGLLAMVRGFLREVLSIAAWLAAAAASLYFGPRLLPAASQYFNNWNEWIVKGGTIAAIFLGTLLLVSVLTVSLSDRVLDSRIGALDRTLGFVFGLARGLIIMVVAFAFFDWLVPQKSQPEWARNARSRVVLKGTGEWMITLLPENLDSYISNVIKKRKGDEEAPEGAPDQRSDSGGSDRNDLVGYDRTNRSGMRALIETKTAR